MNYNDFFVTHNQLRSIDTYTFFRERFSSGEHFINRKNSISFIRIKDDGKIFLSDGHHEVVAAYSLGISLDPKCYIVKEYTYQDMLEVNFKCKYVTPYNPVTHVRKNNFNWFKEAIINIYNGWTYQEKYYPDFPLICERWAREAIKNGSSAYLEERKINHVWEIPV